MIAEQSQISPGAAKKIIAAALAQLGLACRLTARTIDFTDLAGVRVVFVTIHDAPFGRGDPQFVNLAVLARSHGFRIQAD
jgi:hypothetical protein